MSQIVGWTQAAGTVLLGVVGLWLGHNYRRQIRLKLAERQVDAYRQLWSITALARPDRTTPLNRGELAELHQRMMRWYFDEGHGVFVSAATRDLLVVTLANLLCPVSEVKPAVLAAQLAALSEEEAEGRRGCACVRQLALLRHQLKCDLALHLGFGHYSPLRRDERDFLRSCGLAPRRRWRSGPAGRGGHSSCVCGLCPP